MAALPVALPELRMSEQEYLKADFEVEPDFVDGTLEERYVGTYDHNKWQGALDAWFRAHYPEWRLRAGAEWRTRTSATRYRVPDVAVSSMAVSVEQVLTTAPVAIFEILSPEDTLRRTVLKLQDYEQMGVRNIFVIDPEGPLFFRFQDGTLGPADAAFDLTGSPGRIDWQAIQALIY